MTISSNTARVSFNTDGVTALFPVPIQAYSPQDFLVLLTNKASGLSTILTLNSDYTLATSGTLNPTAWNLNTQNGQFPSPYATGSVLQVILNPLETQQTQYQQGQQFPSQSVQTNLDRVTQMAIRLSDQVARAVVAPDGDVAPQVSLPSAIKRASSFQFYDINGNLALTPVTPLPGGSSANLVSFVNSGAGAVPTTLQARGQLTPTVFDWFSAAQQNNVSLGIGSIDVTAAVNQAIAQNPRGNLFIPPGSYLISGAGLTNLVGCSLYGVRYRSTFLLGTQNMNGLSYGDGTSGTRNAASSCRIDGVAFNPLNGVATFTAGSCVVRNNVFDVHINNCDFFGKDSTTVRLWNAITDISTTDCDSNYCNTSQILNNVVNVSGASTSALASDCFYNYHRWNNIGGDAFFVGINVGGLTLVNPTGFAVSGWHVRMNSSAGTFGQNFFISNPDFECDGTGQGIWVQQGNGVGIGGEGWIGGNAACKLIWFGVNASNCKIEGMNLFGGQFVLDGPDCYMKGGTMFGDAVTSTVAVTISTTAVNGAIDGTHIGQYTAAPVQFSGAPPTAFKVRAHFNSVNSGGAEITGLATSGIQPPDCRGCTTDASSQIASASALPLNFGRDFNAVSGATAVNSMTIKSQGDRQILQAISAGGFTVNNTAGIITKNGAATAIPQFKIMELVCDGNATWFELSRNF